jgi:hypothetical protein
LPLQAGILLSREALALKNIEVKSGMALLPKHQTHKETLFKFLLLLAVLLAYFGYLSWKFDLATGGFVAILTWSFFVLCTPVADAGFLLDFPVRLIFGLRMIKSEIIVWGLAIGINVMGLMFWPDMYGKTFLTDLFMTILTTPWPYWSIIVLSGIGTFLSIYFGDEMLDVATHNERVKHHKHGFKYRVVFIIGLFVLIFAAYYNLLASLGIKFDEVF